MPERPVGIEKPGRVRLLRFARVVFRVVLLPVVEAVVKRTVVSGARLAETRGEAVLLTGFGTPLSRRRSEAMAVVGGAMHAPCEQLHPPPTVPLGVDPPCGQARFELVRPQVRNEQLGSDAPVGMEAEPRHPSTGASPDHAAPDLSAFHLVFVGRGNDPTPLGISKRETVRLHLRRRVIADEPGVVVSSHECDVVRGERVSRFGEPLR